MTLTRARPGRWALARRLCVIAAIVARALARLASGWATRWLGARVTGRPAPGPALFADALATLVEDLGPAYVKVAQILGTRADLLPRHVCDALARLYDKVRPPPATAALRAVPAALVAGVEGGTGGLTPLAAGSIACVFRGRLRSGETVAVKVRRPGAVRALSLDLALLESAARLAGRLPRLRGIPLGAVTAQLGDAIYQQLDLAREAEDLAALRSDLAVLPAVRVPAVLAAWSGPDALVLEYLPGLERTRTPPAAEELYPSAVAAMRACFHMLFLAGLVHCDMHPGNLYLLPGGSCVLLDAGFARRLAPYARRHFADFFYAMSRGDGARCADIVLGTATAVLADADEAGFRRDLTKLVEDHSGLAVRDFDLVGFTARLFDLQRRHGFAADPQFVFPILALLVLEGTLKQLCPDVNFQREALPYVLRGLMT
ncbi:MAG: ubiquinone biosynthesis protein [Micromonosporaceae bacterium]